MGVLDKGDDGQRGRGSFGCEFWASHCNHLGRWCTLPKLLWGGLVNLIIYYSSFISHEAYTTSGLLHGMA